MGSLDSFSSKTNYMTENTSFMLTEENEENDRIINSEGIFMENMDLDIQSSHVKREAKKKRPPRENFQSFDKMYSLLVGEHLGSGTYSHVFVCERKEKNERFAAKIIDKSFSIPRERILNEVELHHLCKNQANILNLIKFFEEGSRYIFVYPLMKGGSLLKHIEEKKIFSENESKNIVKDVTAALHFLHKNGVAHRDLKPDNILCDNNETIVPVKICDFDLASGIGSYMKPVSTPVLQTPVGSAEYMAPEVAKAFVNNGEATFYDKRCDLWSLGVILYVMLSGQPPFYGNCGEECGWDRNDACDQCQDLLLHSIQDANYTFTPQDQWQHVSDEAKDVIKHLLVRDASQRYSAEMVLNSSWITQKEIKTQTETPKVQSPLTNFNMAVFLDEANAANRTLAQHAESSKSEKSTLIGLSPPGGSTLAKRRAFKSNIK